MEPKELIFRGVIEFLRGKGFKFTRLRYFGTSTMSYILGGRSHSVVLGLAEFESKKHCFIRCNHYVHLATPNSLDKIAAFVDYCSSWETGESGPLDCSQCPTKSWKLL